MTGEPVELGLLGPFRLSVGRRQIAISTKKTRGLLAILALSPGRQANRERLCGLLWGERSEDQARSSLRQSLAVLRKELGEAEPRIIQTRDDLVILQPFQVDVADLLSPAAAQTPPGSAGSSDNATAISSPTRPFMKKLSKPGWRPSAAAWSTG